ncbi:hypothetical protein CPAR01_03156 [Colletotrichum paranaense]|uniref:Ankyrin repeat protein n=1 Tax=Colletotrichum paranaense TaxID=1914294 RepID=A0ABQ9T1Q3_9PEZI|nr:uncharacterized protein CPAR01_03156 [Colletotrichum paranaense]KAK1545654.1 hypothetical protein CPAR01_03156 [Colletotrichum paranaense]
MADPLSVIGTVIGLITAADAAYDKIKAIKDLPEAFAEVSLRLPIAREILRKIDEKYENLSVATAKIIAPIIESCFKNAEALKTILEALPPPKDATSNWDSIVKKYISIIKIRGKKERVETLTRNILKDIQLLADHETIREAADQSQLKKLEDAIKAIEDVEASISDELLEESRGVNITHGGQGAQNFQVGDNNKQFSHFGTGHVIETANFGPSSENRKAKALKRLNSPSCREHKDRNPKATANTCKWFTEHTKFNDWLGDNHSPLLWVSADPGCGKSVLARHLIDQVLPSLRQSSMIIYFFFKYGNEDQEHALKAVKGLLDQLLRNGSPLFAESILNSLEELGETKLDSFSELWNVLHRVMRHRKSDKIICVLDALDECKEGWDDLARGLGDIAKSRSASTRILLLSRPYRVIQNGIMQGGMSVIHLHGEDTVEVDKISTEINLVIKERVNKLDVGPRNRERVYEEISQRENRTYLWAHLICDMLSEVDFVTSDLHEHLRQLPATVEDMYENILNRSSDIRKAKTLLHIVVVAARPFSLEEMAMAMAVESCSSSDEKPPVIETAIFQKSIRNICGLFLVIKDDKVFLIHQTAREFLTKESSRSARKAARSGTALNWKGCLDQDESNKLMTSICLRYLLYVGDHDPPPRAEGGLKYEFEVTTMYEYAATYWISHYQSSNLYGSSEFIRDILRLFDTEWPSCRIWHNVFEWNHRMSFYLEHAYEHNGSCRMTSLELVSFHGLEAPFKTLLKEGTHNLLESKALFYAVESGNNDLVQLIIDEMMNQPNFFSRRNSFKINLHLLLAVDGRHEAIFETIMNFKRAEIDRSYERIAPGHVEQIGRSTGPSTRNELGEKVKHSRGRKRSTSIRYCPKESWLEQEALIRAARSGQLAIVRKLLKKFRVDPAYAQDSNGNKPFANAAKYGHVDVVKFLLKYRRVDPDTQISALGIQGGINQYGFYYYDLPEHAASQTPISLAAEHGHLDVVNVLLESGKVRSDSRDDHGRTPLSHAARHGHLDVVNVLLESGKVRPDSQDNYGRTSLSHAAGARYLDAAEKLLKIDRVDINSRDAGGITPLAYAARHGNYAVVKTFLDTGNVDERSKMLSLALAVQDWHETIVDIVDLLLSSDSLEANLSDETKMKLTSLAVKNYHLPVLRFLHERWKPYLGLTNTRRILDGSLIAQAITSPVRVFEYIFDAGQLDVNVEYSWEHENGSIHYSTLLRRAARENMPGIVKALLSRGADVNLRSGRKGETPLITGVKCCHWSAVDALLFAGGIDLSLRYRGQALENLERIISEGQ